MVKDDYQIDDRKPLSKFVNQRLSFQAVLLKRKARFSTAIRPTNTDTELVFVSVKCLTDRGHEYDHFVYHCNHQFVEEHQLKIGHIYRFTAQVESYYTCKRIYQIDGTHSLVSTISYGITQLAKIRPVDPKRINTKLSKWSLQSLRKLGHLQYPKLFELNRTINNLKAGAIELAIDAALEEQKAIRKTLT